MIELGILALTIAGFLVLLDRKDARAHKDRESHRSEVAGLCQRIQAPERAVVEHATQDARDQPAVSPFSHEDYWDAKEEEQRALARIEQLEREMN